MNALTEFNELLNKKPQQRVGVIESDGDRSVDSAVSGKLTPELLKEAIEEAIKECFDYEDVTIVSADPYDFGYALEIKVSYVLDNEENEERYYITHVMVY